MSKVTAGLIVAVVVLLAPARAWAIAVRAPCETPFVFPDAALNVVVLPYAQAPTLRGGDAKVGEQLAGLVELEALLAVAKYGSIGLVQQPVGDEQCTAENVLDKLLGRRGGARNQVKPGKAVIVIWGRIFQSGRDLYLQSYLRFLRRDTAERVTLTIDGHPLAGRLSSQALGCPPRKVSLADLAAIEKQYASSSLLRANPNMNADFVPLPEGGPFSFWITQVQGDWVQLQPMADQETLPRGWVRARSEDPQWSLRRRMPELALLEGIGGYLAARATPKAPRAMLDAADAALAQYLERWKEGALLSGDDAAGSGMGLAVAVPAQLQGFLALLRGEPSRATLTAAAGHFQRALKQVPFSGDARNLETMTRLVIAARDQWRERPPRGFVDDMMAAVSSEPDNPDVLANLGTVYDLALAPKAGLVNRELSAADRFEFQRQRTAIRQMLQRKPAAGTR